MFLFIGLGNKGSKYQNNRHNTGFLFLDYPGKYKLERKIVSTPLILKGLNWIRSKSNKPPLKI